MKDSQLIYEMMDYKLPPEAAQEAQALWDEGFFVKHRDNDQWVVATLHGGDWWQPNTHDHYGNTVDDYHWTEASEAAPKLTKFFKEDFIFETYKRVRVMALLPGGKIPRHHDANTPERREAALTSFQRGAINACITQPENCFIKDSVDNVEVACKPGDIWWFNCWREHEAENNSDEIRFHMVIHGWKRRN